MDDNVLRELLTRYEREYVPQREQLRAMYAEAEKSGDYSDADEYSADLGEQAMELVQAFADIVREGIDQ